MTRITLFSPKKIEAGIIVMTRRVMDEIVPEDAAYCISKHVRGDWGLVCEEDKLENEFALDKELRILSEFKDSKGKRFWIITEADRSATTVLLPEEY